MDITQPTDSTDNVLSRSDTGSLPEDRTASGASSTSNQIDNESDTSSDGEGNQNQKVLTTLLGTTAFGWYLSVLLHLLSYGTAATIFALMSVDVFFEPEKLPPLRATLDDRDFVAEEPAIELTPDINDGITQTESSTQQLASNLSVVDNGLIETLNDPGITSLESGQKEGKGEDEGPGFLFRIPESGLAVTKGSFTAWTEPENPTPGTPYLIIIEVRLPDDTRRYRVADLRGKVVGSDGYDQNLPYDSRGGRGSTFYTTETEKIRLRSLNETIEVLNNKIQLAVSVPGADSLIEDTITIRSRRLREEHEIVLVFGSRRPRSN